MSGGNSSVLVSGGRAVGGRYVRRAGNAPGLDRVVWPTALEGRAELVGRLAHLAEQGREDAPDRKQRRAGDAGVDRHRLPGSGADQVEELLGGQRPGCWQMPDLTVCLPAISQNQQPAGDVRQVMEGVNKR